MQVEDYDLFLFDFDGLLVDTEPLHLEAYKRTLKDVGYDLNWDLTHYCNIAHISSDHLRATLEENFPKLADIGWEALYAKKKQNYLSLLKDAHLQMMPGAEAFLTQLKKPTCVVTHSPKEQIDLIKDALPQLHQIPHWFTREDYTYPKPHPDGYLAALRALHGTNPIGFEDSIRGLQSLQAAQIPAVLIRPPYYPPATDVSPTICATTFHDLL